MLTLVTTPTATQTGTLTAGSPTVTGLSDTSLLAGALGVTGSGVPLLTYVQTIDSPTQLTLTNSAYSAGSVPLTFAIEPITLAEAKAHLRVTFTEDDNDIAMRLIAAREKCESHTNRSFLTTTWQQTLDGFPGQFSRFSPALGSFAQGSYGYGMGALYGYIPERLLAGTGEPIIIPKARLVAVPSITYIDNNGAPQTMDPSLYSVEPGDGGRISPGYNTTWPQARVYPGSIVITVQFGYGTSPTNVPMKVKAGILLALGHLYEHRESVTDTNAWELPQGIRWVLASADWGCRP